MARHLVPASLEHFNELVKHITFSGQLSRDSAFNRSRFIEKWTRNGVIPYKHAYKTTVGDLRRLPMYAMVDGIHNHKWQTFSIYTGERLGSAFYSILSTLPHNRNRNVGNRLEYLYSELNSTSSFDRMHRGLMCVPFVLNPAACRLPQEDLPSFIEDCIDGITQLPDYMYTLREHTSYKGTYNEVHSSLGNVNRGGVYTNWQFKKGNISVCYGSIVDFTNKKVLAMLTLNPEYLEYYLLHKYSQSTIVLQPEIFNIVVDEEFAKNSGELYAKELWQLARKGMIQAVDPRITTEVIDGGEFFSELYGNIISDPPRSLGPLEQIEQNAEMQEEFINSTAAANTLRERNIVLTD